jgi:bacteriorhodopsin
MLVSLVNAVSTTLYAGKCLGFVTVLPTRVAGQFFLPLRYVQWAFTTACLIRAVACLSPDSWHTRALLRRTLLADLVMLAACGAERYAAAPISLAAFAVGAACFVRTMSGQYALFAAGARTLSTPGDKVALAALRRMTTLTWLLFPAARVLVLLGLLGPCGEEVVFTLVDIAAKFGFSTFLLVGAFSVANKG